MKLEEARAELPPSLYVRLRQSVEDLDEEDREKVIDKTVERYKKINIEPGEGIGTVSAQSIGEPGTQLSIAPWEKVVVKLNDKVKAVKIEKLVDGIIGRKEGKMKSVSLSLDLEVPSLSSREKLEWKEVESLTRHKNKEKLLKIEMRSGREITATQSHSFVIRKENRIKPIKGEDLKVGDRLPVLRQFSLGGSKRELDLERYLSKRDFLYGKELTKALDGGNFVLPIQKDQIRNYQKKEEVELEENKIYPLGGLKKGLPRKLGLDWPFGFFIGAYLAEGSVEEKGGWVNFSNTNEDFLFKIKNFAEERLGLSTKIYRRESEYGTTKDLRVYSTVLAKLLRKLCKTGSYNKEVPSFCYTANPDFVKGLLNAYLSGDGNVNVERNVIRAHSTSKELIDGISLLLNKFGIFSRKGKEDNKHTLKVYHKYASVLSNKIGLIIEEKKSRLKELVKKFEGTKEKKYTYDQVEMYTGFGKIFYRLADELGMPKRYINNFTKRQRIGRTTLARYIEKFKNLAKKKGVKPEGMKLLERMYNSDVIYDEIVGIEEVEHDGYVYDISVNGLDTFTTFDGVITHNTMETFHHAGVAEISVAKGLPRMIEIFDARRSPSTPSMTIFLGEEYRKDKKKARKVASGLLEIKISDIAESISSDILELEITVELDEDSLEELDLEPKEAISALEDEFSDLNVKKKGNKIIISPSEEVGVKDLYELAAEINETYVTGVSGITQVLVKKGNNLSGTDRHLAADDEYVVKTAGSNLKKVLKLDKVDGTRTITNDLWEIYRVLGVEAVRQAIINEAVDTLEDQGLEVDVRHILLVADMMTASGELQGITRYGIAGNKSSILHRASFEVATKHLFNAATHNEKDELRGIVENVMVTQNAPVGTGYPKLRVKGSETEDKEG